jgi:hypothetical protein
MGAWPIEPIVSCRSKHSFMFYLFCFPLPLNKKIGPFVGQVENGRYRFQSFYFAIIGLRNACINCLEVEATNPRARVNAFGFYREK